MKGVLQAQSYRAVGILAEGAKRRQFRSKKSAVQPVEHHLQNRQLSAMAASASSEVVAEASQGAEIRDDASGKETPDAAGSEAAVGTHKFSASAQVDAALIKFVRGRRGEMKKSIEKETCTTISIPSRHNVKNSHIVIKGSSQEAVDAAVTRVHSIVDEATRSRSLDYSHFISLPLGVLPGIMDQLIEFQESVLDLAKRACEKTEKKNSDATEGIIPDLEVDNEKESCTRTEQKSSNFTEGAPSCGEINNENIYTETAAGGNDEDEVPEKTNADEDPENLIADEAPEKLVSYELKTEQDIHSLVDAMKTGEITEYNWGIEKSIFVKPATFHLTVLMLKLWNNDRVVAAAEALQRCKSKVHEALEGLPVSVRIKGLKCMRGSPEKAHVLYACVEEADQGSRLARACQVIRDEFDAAGLAFEADIEQDLKLHATLMNTRHQNMKMRKWQRKQKAFDARQIFSEYGSIDFGEHCIQEVHLSQRFSYGANGYYVCCGYIELPRVTS